jgi:hypothetical protein
VQNIEFAAALPFLSLVAPEMGVFLELVGVRRQVALRRPRRRTVTIGCLLDDRGEATPPKRAHHANVTSMPAEALRGLDTMREEILRISGERH